MAWLATLSAIMLGNACNERLVFNVIGTQLQTRGQVTIYIVFWDISSFVFLKFSENVNQLGNNTFVFPIQL